MQALHSLAVCAVGNLARDADNRRDIGDRQGVHVLLKLCNYERHPVVVQLHALSALANLTHDSEEHSADAGNCLQLVQEGGLRTMLELAGSSNVNVQVPTTTYPLVILLLLLP